MTIDESHDALADWQRRRDAWQIAVAFADGDERVLLLCGVAVAVRCIRQIELDRDRDEPIPAPAGKVGGTWLRK